MSTIQTVKAQIQSLIDKANETTGNTDTNLTDGVNALVEGFGQGGDGGIEGGYDVTFYDVEESLLAFFSIMQGQSIHPPVYDTKAWVTENGEAITFPYTPTGDLTLYADNSTLAQKLYSHYGLSETDYPYMIIFRDSSASDRWAIVMSKKLVFGKTSVIFNGYYWRLTISSGSVDLTKPEQVANCFIRGGTTKYSGDTSLSVVTNYNLYVNGKAYEAYTASGLSWETTIYRLDETEEKLPYDGLANGYDVMFYDENNEGLAFYSIRKGDGINAPVYNAKKWLDNNGNVVVFPYVPTSDILLYADQSGCVSVLYELYGISPIDYPYMIISYCISTQRILIYFCDKYDVVDNKVRVWKKTLPIMTDYVDTTLGTNPTIEEIVVALQGGDNTLYANPDSVYYTNNSVGSYDNYILFTNITDTIQTTSQVIVIE